MSLNPKTNSTQNNFWVYFSFARISHSFPYNFVLSTVYLVLRLFHSFWLSLKFWVFCWYGLSWINWNTAIQMLFSKDRKKTLKLLFNVLNSIQFNRILTELHFKTIWMPIGIIAIPIPSLDSLNWIIVVIYWCCCRCRCRRHHQSCY